MSERRELWIDPDDFINLKGIYVRTFAEPESDCVHVREVLPGDVILSAEAFERLMKSSPDANLVEAASRLKPQLNALETAFATVLKGSKSLMAADRATHSAIITETEVLLCNLETHIKGHPAKVRTQPTQDFAMTGSSGSSDPHNPQKSVSTQHSIFQSPVGLITRP